MKIQIRRELINQIREHYLQSNLKEKKNILDDLVVSTGYGRKYAVTLLKRGIPLHKNRTQQKHMRLYDEPVRNALIKVWQAANRICSKRLVPFLPEFVSALERFGHLALSPDVRDRLLTISPATVDRLLHQERYPKGKGRSLTRPGSLIKRQIKVRTFADWSDVAPGFFEADLVAHCGERAEGAFLNTLVLTDIATGWTECLALLRRSETDVTQALDTIRNVLPFPFLGLDTDNGSEFINYEMLQYCQREKITFTRSRAYRKNDQAHVEEKNGSIVRRLVGYDRYEGVEAWRALDDLYAILREYINFFQPSMKLLVKEKLQGHISKHYDSAQTPFQRLLASSRLNEAHRLLLQEHYVDLDPLAILGEVEKRQDHFWSFAHRKTVDETFPEIAEIPLEIESETARRTDQQSIPPESPRYYRRTAKPKKPRDWRTRQDPFEQVWKEIRIQLQIDPRLTAKLLFERLQKKYPGRFNDGQLRTLQRRVREWRQQNQHSDFSIRSGFYSNVAAHMEVPATLSTNPG